MRPRHLPHYLYKTERGHTIRLLMRDNGDVELYIKSAEDAGAVYVSTTLTFSSIDGAEDAVKAISEMIEIWRREVPAEDVSQ